MALLDGLGEIKVPRNLPLGLLAAAIVSGTGFWFTSIANDRTILTRIDKIETKIEMREKGDIEQAKALSRIETLLSRLSDDVKEIRAKN